MLESIITENDIVRSKHHVYGILKEPLLAFEKSMKSENNINTFNLGSHFLSEYRIVLEDTHDAFKKADEYIELNFNVKENIDNYKDIFTECNNEVVKLASFVKRTNSYFESRKNSHPFVFNKDIYKIMTMAVKSLITLHTKAIVVREGIKKDGVNFLVNLL